MLTWLAVGVAIAAVSGLLGGGVLGYRYASSQGEAALASLQRDHAVASTEASRRALVRYQAETELGGKLAQAVIDQRVQIATLQQQLKRRIPHVTTVYQPTPGAVPVALPRVVLTRGFLRDWNRGFGLPTDDTTTATGRAAPAGTDALAADSWLLRDDLLDSGASLADVLQHAQDYGAWCQRQVAQRDKLIDLAQGHE